MKHNELYNTIQPKQGIHKTIKETLMKILTEINYPADEHTHFNKLKVDRRVMISEQINF